MTFPRKMKKVAWTRPSHRRAGNNASRGFTLVELLLALAIMAVLLSLAALSVNALQARRTLPDAADHLASAMRMARADAATFGRRIRLTMNASDFDDAGPFGLFEIELDPLGAPGTFTPHNARWTRVLDRDDVEVLQCRQTSESTWAVMQTADGNEPDAFQPIMFYPDGSCDSAEIHLRLLDDPEGDVAIVTLDGMNAAASYEILSAEAYQDHLQEAANP